MATQAANSSLSDPWQLWSYWLSLLQTAASASPHGAPNSLQQSILPWSFTGLVVNETNSSDPAAEQAIVASDSYGRQLGRISDALDYLVGRLAANQGIDAGDDRLAAFTTMKQRIDAIKSDAESARFECVLKDLKNLKQHDGKKFSACVARIAAL